VYQEMLEIGAQIDNMAIDDEQNDLMINIGYDKYKV